MCNSALANPKKKKLKQSQGNPSKPKKIGRKNPRTPQRSWEKVEGIQIESVVVRIGEAPLSGSETLRRKNGGKCVGNLSDASDHVEVIWNGGEMDVSVRISVKRISNNVSVTWRWRDGNRNISFNLSACRRNMRWKWNASSKTE